MRHCNLALAGFMGTGKSTVGPLVAKQLGWRFLDTDAIIEARAGRSIPQIFAESGEANFRAREAHACADAFAGCHRVIALGGGALLSAQTRALVEANSVLICLDADLDELLARVGHDATRPLFHADRDKLAALYAARAPHYASLPHHVSTAGRSPAAVAEEVIKLWQQHR